MADEPNLEACRERALLLLSQRMHSTAELSRKLLRKGFPEKHVAEVTEDFQRVGLLDDREYAAAFCRQRLEGSRPLGRTRLRVELRRRGVDEPIAEEAIETTLADLGEHAEYDLALDAGREKWSQLASRGRDETLKIKQKVYRFLAGRGFAGHHCGRVLDALEAEFRDVGDSERNER